MRKNTLALVALLALVAPAVPASAQVVTELDGKHEIAGKRAIRSPGSYFLSRDIRGDDGDAIEILSDNVTLDLRGHSMVGLGDRAGTAISISGASNVRVYGGTIRDFGLGVRVVDSTNVTLSDLQIDGQDLGGAPPEVEIGVLLLNSRGVTVRDNTISNTFLGIFVRGGGSGANLIADNLIAGGDHGELAICYNPAPGGTSSLGPSGDLITGNAVGRFRRAFSFSAESTGNVLRGNSFAYFELGVVEATPGSNVIEDNDEVEIAP